MKQIFLIKVELEEEENLGGDEQGQEDEEQGKAVGGDPHISIHALAGVAGPRTMRTQACIGKFEVTILVTIFSL